MMMIYCEIDILYSLRAEHSFSFLPNLGISPFLIVNKRVGCGGEYDRQDKEGLEQTDNIIFCEKYDTNYRMSHQFSPELQ